MPLTAEDQAKYRSLYFTTAKPYVQELQNAMSTFLQGTMDESKKEVAHRSAHSLKSQSEMMGFHQISSVSGAIEHIFQAHVEKTLELTPDLLQIMKTAVDAIADAVQKLENNETEPDLSVQKDALVASSHIQL